MNEKVESVAKKDEERIARLKEFVKTIPLDPGIYIMKNKNDEIIYVGKAKSLRKRVRQYFNKNGKVTRILKMVENIDHIEYIVVHNELEALVLECNYIKENKPKYNVLLKDDKNYPYIKITLQDEFPSMYIVRQVKQDGAKYFGPYTDVSGIRDIFNLLKQIFPLKRCKYNLNKQTNVGPCLYYHIGRCLGPCIDDVNKQEYRQMVNEIILFLEGKTKQVEEYMKQKIDECITKLEFEKAAVYKERLDKLGTILAKQTVSNLNEVSTDVWGYKLYGNTAYIQIFKIRSGKLKKHDTLEINDVEEDELNNSLSTVICSYYTENVDIPKKVYFNVKNGENVNVGVMQEYMSNMKGQKVEINIPKKGDKLKLIYMIENNIEINHKEKAANVLEELASLLNLKENIESIEAYDISNLKNDYIVGAGICFEGNKLNKNKYRKFKIKGIMSQNDVYAMSEVIKRRIKHIEEWGQPDLICIDGGKNQVNAVKEVLLNYNLDIPVIGMIKDDKHRTRGIIDINGKEVDLRKSIQHKSAFNFLTFIQDEVHRFVITYHRKLRDSVK